MEPQDIRTSDATAAPASEQAWSDYISPFAAAIGVTTTEVTERLKTLVGDPGIEAIDALKNEEYTPFTDIQTVLSSVPSARIRKAVAENLRIKQDAAPAVGLVLRQGRTQGWVYEATVQFRA